MFTPAIKMSEMSLPKNSYCTAEINLAPQTRELRGIWNTNLSLPPFLILFFLLRSSSLDG